MLEKILEWDYWLFSKINGEWTNTLMDFTLVFFRNKYFWVPFYLFILVFLWVNFNKKKAFFIALFMILTIVLTDQISSSFFKPFFGRLRPCNLAGFKETVDLLVSCGSGKSFVSSHAANHFGIAVYLISIFRKHFSYLFPLLLILWASIISYAQIYVGVHFPLDILGGASLGILCGLLTAYFAKIVLNNLRE